MTQNIIVTFDSNVEYLSKTLSRKIYTPTKNWCYRVNDCVTDLKNKNIKFYYNTPISMTDDKFGDNSTLVRMANSKIFTNFIYIDEAKNNDAKRRIRANFAKLKNPIIQITRNSPADYGYYNIKNSQNYPDAMIVSLIAKIINYYITTNGLLLDPETWLQGVPRTIDEHRRFITYDFNDSVERYIDDNTKITKDCEICEL